MYRAFFVALSLWLTSEALPIADGTKGFVGLDVKKTTLTQVGPHSISRRASSSQSDPLWELDNKHTYYTVTVGVGSPAQPMEVLLDTGSSDFWVDATSSHENHFDFEKSSSFKKNDTSFSIGYGDSSKVNGFWGSDKISAFGNSFDASFGVATDSTATSPIMGLGLMQGEVSVSAVDQNGNLTPTYPNFPSLLKLNGLIHRASYSLWLKDATGANGTVLFGGIDHSKYLGDSLSLLPIVNDHSVGGAQHPTSLSVLLHKVAVSGGGSSFSSALNTPVLLDTGSTLCQLPDSFVDKLGESLNGEFDDKLGVYSLDCSSHGTLHFNFSGAVIPVDVPDLMLPYSMLGSSDHNRCALAIYKSGSRKSILGEGFLKNAYVVFDLEGLQIGIAPASNNSDVDVAASSTSATSVEAIVTGIPSATKAPQYSYTQFAESSK